MVGTQLHQVKAYAPALRFLQGWDFHLSSLSHLAAGFMPPGAAHAIFCCFDKPTFVAMPKRALNLRHAP